MQKIHDEPVTIADSTEALADDKAHAKDFGGPVEHFPTYKILMIVWTVIWKIEMVYQFMQIDLK